MDFLSNSHSFGSDPIECELVAIWQTPKLCYTECMKTKTSIADAMEQLNAEVFDMNLMDTMSNSELEDRHKYKLLDQFDLDVTSKQFRRFMP